MNTLIKNSLLVCFLFCGLTVFAQNSTLTLKGNWTYAVPDAPYGYEKGTIEFKQADDILSATIKNTNGTYNIRNLKKDNNQYTSTFYVDGSEVVISLTPQTDKITGVVKVEGYDLPITLTPVKE